MSQSGRLRRLGGWWRLGGLSWRQLGRGIWRQLLDDEVLGRSAELAYYFLFSLFPLLLFLTALLGYLVEESAQLRQQLFAYLATVLPSEEAVTLVQDTLTEVREARSGGKLSFGLVGSVWIASTGMLAVGRSLNAAFDLNERRPWWARRLIAALLTIVFAVLIIGALVLLFYGEAIGRTLAERAGFGGLFLPLWRLLQWTFLLAAVTLSFDLIYNFAPDQDRRNWLWLTPGAVAAVALWLIASFTLRVYLEQFAYSRTYGSLGAVIVLLFWFYLTGAAILIGGEVNSEICKSEPRGIR